VCFDGSQQPLLLFFETSLNPSFLGSALVKFFTSVGMMLSDPPMEKTMGNPALGP
jgi:hypothetical protein